MAAGTLLLGGTDLGTLADIEDLSDFWSSSDARGDLPTYPGIPGAVSLARPVASKVCSGQVTVARDTLAAAEDAVASLKAVLRQGMAQTFTRRKITGSGNLDATQTGIVRTVEERWIGPTACTVILGAEMVDGLWYGSSITTASAPATLTILGDAATRKLTATLSAGAARTVMNNTNGYYFQFLTTVPTGGVTVDVKARTATAITGGADMSSYLQWGKTAPMQLEPGGNSIAVDSGTATFSYQPAYL